MANYTWPSVITSQGPIQFELDGTPTVVSEDTGTPANSEPLPVKVMDGSGILIDFATEAKQDVQITEAQTANTLLTDIETNTSDTATNTADAVTELVALNAVDFATQTTLAAVLSDTSSIDGKLPGTLGQKAMAASLAVVIASDQSTVPVSLASVPLPAGAATEAKQDAQIVLETDIETNTAATVTELQTLNAVDFATETTLVAMSAKLPATLGQKTAANSLAVVPASDYTPKTPVNTSGSVVNGSLTATTASAETAPAGAVGFMVEAPSTNTDNIRYRVGGTASTTAGMLMEPGRDSGFVPCGANLSICATVSGTNAYSILWVIQ